MAFQDATKYFQTSVERFGDTIVTKFQPDGCTFNEDPTQKNLLCLRFGATNPSAPGAILYIIAIDPDNGNMHYLVRVQENEQAVVMFDHNKHEKNT